jgi:hypothetical protein
MSKRRSKRRRRRRRRTRTRRFHADYEVTRAIPQRIKILNNTNIQCVMQAKVVS